MFGQTFAFSPASNNTISVAKHSNKIIQLILQEGSMPKVYLQWIWTPVNLSDSTAAGIKYTVR